MLNYSMGKLKSLFGYEEKMLPGLRYHFRKYTWAEGSARNEWIPDTLTYPYAFVSEKVSMIEYAYSERRWPAEQFELMESNPQYRQQVMQKVSLLPEETPQSFPFAQLSEKVADFNPDGEKFIQDVRDNDTRRTALGYNPKHTIQITDKGNQERARVIAVHDPIGNIADVSCYHEYVWANSVQEQQKYTYAVTTAKAVKSVQPFITKDRNDKRTRFNSGYPVDQGNFAELEHYASQAFSAKRAKEIDNIAKVHLAMIEQSGNFTLRNQLAVAIEQNKNFAAGDTQRLLAVEAYAAFLYSAAMQQLGISNQGMQQQARALATDKPYGQYLVNLLAISKQVATGYKQFSLVKGIKRLELETLFETVTSAQVYRWTMSSHFPNSISHESFLSAWALKLEKKRGSLKVIANSIEAQVKGFLQQKADLSRGISQWNALANTVATSDAQASFALIVHETPEVQARQSQLHLTQRMGVFLSFLSLAQTIKGLQEDADSPLIIPVLQVSSDMMGFVAAFEYKAHEIADAGRGQLLKRSGSTLRKVFTDNEVRLLGQSFEPMAQGTGSFNRLLPVIGRCANVLAVTVATYQAVKFNRRGDKAAMASAISGGLAEVAFFAATFIWATPLIIVGIVLVLASLLFSWFKDNDYEAWVRNSFWGNSDDYWGEDRDEKLPYSIRLENSFVLAEPNNTEYKKIKTFFEEEMQAYYNLVWGIEIRNTTKGDKKLLLYCPAFTDSNCLSKLKITWIQRQRQLNNREGLVETTRNLHADKIAKEWLVSGYIQLDFSQAMPRNLFALKKDGGIGLNASYSEDQAILTVRYPRLGEEGWFTDYFSNQKIFTDVNEI